MAKEKERVKCGDCIYFQPPNGPAAEGDPLPLGACHRLPKTEPRKSTVDWCGEGKKP